MIKYLSILFCVLLAFQAMPGYAQPKPQNKKEVLGNINAQLESEKSAKKNLERNAGAAKKDYESTRKDLIKTGAAIQKNQKALHDIETRLTDLRAEQAQIKAELQAERKALGETITALERIRRTPPEAMIARPAAPIDTARGAMLLQRILPVLHEKARALKEKAERYAANEEELQSKQRKLVALSEDLDQKEKNLQRLVADRKKLYASINSDITARSKAIDRISKEARNLADLVSKLEDERTRNASRRKQQQSKPQKVVSLPAIGKSQLPLKGVLRTKYNQTDDFGAQSKGVSIEGRAGALIVSPMGGVIRFAGYFKNYGNMVIIEHQNGYHSLIAGLEKIDTVVDQSVSAGEPLGRLYRSTSSKAPTLYFELRYKGKAINPARKFTELG